MLRGTAQEVKDAENEEWTHATNLVKVTAVFSVAILDVPHQEIQRSSAEKNLTHSSIVDLSSAVVQLDPDIPQPMAE